VVGDGEKIVDRDGVIFSGSTVIPIAAGVGDRAIAVYWAKRLVVEPSLRKFPLRMGMTMHQCCAILDAVSAASKRGKAR
jgi:hypothetical protein